MIKINDRVYMWSVSSLTGQKFMILGTVVKIDKVTVVVQTDDGAFRDKFPEELFAVTWDDRTPGARDRVRFRTLIRELVQEADFMTYDEIRSEMVEALNAERSPR